MDNVEYGNKLIRLGKLMKSDKTKLKDLVAAALDCGLIYTFGLTPHPTASVDLAVDANSTDTGAVARTEDMCEWGPPQLLNGELVQALGCRCGENIRAASQIVCPMCGKLVKHLPT